MTCKNEVHSKFVVHDGQIGKDSGSTITNILLFLIIISLTK